MNTGLLSRIFVQGREVPSPSSFKQLVGLEVLRAKASQPAACSTKSVQVILTDHAYDDCRRSTSHHLAMMRSPSSEVIVSSSLWLSLSSGLLHRFP